MGEERGDGGGTRLEEKYILACLSKKKLLSENVGSGRILVSWLSLAILFTFI